jgi:hypothetical protein
MSQFDETTNETIEDRYNEDAWIRSTLVVPNEP